jgi:hypothetical protein
MAADYGYGVFTARYGNIYTARQFLQTIKRAYGLFVPRDDAWLAPNGRVVDPYRPRIQPDGFSCQEELIADRAQHFAAIRRAIEEARVFVFTLGLTEAWFNKSDGAVYPLCPGVAGGVFDDAQHGFANLGVMEVIADLSESIALMRERNPDLRLILTVSPVPLVATMEDRSVLASTTYSKSVLRVAAEEVAARYEGVDYFPSYEIITGNHTRGRYFDDDLREVTAEGVAHVMRLFLRHYGTAAARPTSMSHPSSTEQRQSEHDGVKRELAELAEAMCDEMTLDAASAPVPATPTADEAAPAHHATNTAEARSAWDLLSGASPPSQPSVLPPMLQPPKGLWSWFRRRH